MGKKNLNLKNFNSTSNNILRLVFANRILTIIMLFGLPIMIALWLCFDDGIQDLVGYILYWISDKHTSFPIDDWNNKLGGLARTFRIFIPLIGWALTFIIVLFFVFIGIFSISSGKGRIIQSVCFIIITLLWISVLVTVQFTKNNFYNTYSGVSGDISYLDAFWHSMQSSYKIYSIHFIGMWIFVLFSLSVFIIELIEGILILKNKLSFSKLFVDDYSVNSMANKIFSSEIEFGENYTKPIKNNKKNRKYVKEKQIDIKNEAVNNTDFEDDNF